MDIFWLDAKETKAIVKSIVDKMDARDCSCPLYLFVTPCGCSHTVIGEKVLQKLHRWLSPPDPSMNYTTGLRNLHEKTATWFLQGDVFNEWHSTGSLLWIYGKRTFVQTRRLLVS